MDPRGKRRLAIVTADDQRAGMRQRSFAEAAAHLGLGEVHACVVPAPTTLGSGRRGLADLLKRHPAIDAVFCSSDVLALGVITEAQSRGLAVPDDFSVFGFGDLGFAGDTHPPLTTVRIDGTAIGRQAARFIIDRAEGRIPAQSIVDLGFTIAERQSV